MKKIVASVGLLALGASTIQAATVPGFVGTTDKPWSVEATLRGFYDDNINSAPNDADLGDFERDSFGFEVSPRIGLYLGAGGATEFSAAYKYSYRYYDNRPSGSTGHDDSSHTFDMALDHAFSERYQIAVKDSFVIGQEPDLLRTGNTMTTFQRVDGDNIRNFGAIQFNGQATRLFGYELGYANSFYDYEDDNNNFFVAGQPSLSAMLDRIEHSAHFDTRWQIQPETVGVVGYQYREIDYTGDQAITEAGDAQSDDRNSRAHYAYVGGEHNFSPHLSAALRLGAQFTDYYNSPTDDDSISPYALANVRYTYMPESYLEVGVTHDRNATDLSYSTLDEDVTMDQESTVFFASVTHRIMPKVYGSLLGQFQNSAFYGGPWEDETENYFMAGVNLEYRFNRNFSAHVGYNFDLLDSDLEAEDGTDPRDMDRNRVYIGITARY